MHTARYLLNMRAALAGVCNIATCERGIRLFVAGNIGLMTDGVSWLCCHLASADRTNVVIMSTGGQLEPHS